RLPTNGANSAIASSIISWARSRCSGCRSRADPTARRAFPAPLSPCGPCPTRPANAQHPYVAWRSPAPPDPPAADRPAWPTPPTPPGRVADATPRSTTCTSPPDAATHPYPPYPDRRTPPKSAPCTPRSTTASAPSPAPPDQAPGYSTSLGMAPRSPSQDKVSKEAPPRTVEVGGRGS